MKMAFKFDTIINIGAKAPVKIYSDGVEPKEAYTDGSIELWFDYADGSKTYIDDIELIVEPNGFLIMYRIGENVFCTRQPQWMTFNGKRNSLYD